ncbi:DNA-formamidopyrimidine glycosylase family protein [Humibacter ginsenosidimutans]|uniref:Fpg/Nei family DNA glycosylase n=1 Tax=Humibacter ginsenosidimutans TaxID=2599293 RepID=A0A5B8M358_9MICO|nr:DNA-formamidopyrimidine glycosylase family protein [Humibacter ginsenosidimutans]QDZ14591.1 Fpg/Nei family DNA glycosylase [Humibacter ginsenosidimutans]
MPELPEVHALAADLDGRLRGHVVDRLDVTAFAALKTFDPPVSALHGMLVASVGRHGKFLDATLVASSASAVSDERGGAGRRADGELHLIIHLARAGWIRRRDAAPIPSARPRGRSTGPLAARLVLDDGSGLDITEAGTKKSLAIWLVRNPDDVPGIANLGPDPLAPEFTEQVLAGILAAAGRSQLKGVLRSQSRIAGIGNAYSDEILWAAKMSPFKPADMPPGDVHTLYEAMQRMLREALERADGLKASELKAEKKSNLNVHGRFGEPCPRCGDTIRQVIYADSTFQYCPTCQTGGKPLADRVLSRLLK